jgi:8-amino-7-oxononanoate synthase
MTDVPGTLETLRRQGLYRQPRILDSAAGPRVTVDGAQVILLCSNDYLGLAGHPAVRAAAADAAAVWGAGSGASRLVSGSLTPHHQLEAELAQFKGHEACVLFGSGYLANIGVIAALADHGDVILSDALNHASIIDGCRLARAETIVYEHRDLDSLAAALKRADGRRPVIITDAVFSMDGDLAPLRDIMDLARPHRARVIVDEAHATGVIGPGGRGLVAALGLESEVDIVIGTLSKALGSYGAFACCTNTMAQFLINRARTFTYSTALPPPAVAAAHTSLAILRDTPEIVDRLRTNARTLSGLLAASGLPVTPTDIPIIPIITGDPRHATTLSDQALRNGVFAQAIRPPTVPAGTSRLRLVAMASHTERDLQEAARALSSAALKS